MNPMYEKPKHILPTCPLAALWSNPLVQLSIESSQPPKGASRGWVTTKLDKGLERHSRGGTPHRRGGNSISRGMGAGIAHQVCESLCGLDAQRCWVHEPSCVLPRAKMGSRDARSNAPCTNNARDVHDESIITLPCLRLCSLRGKSRASPHSVPDSGNATWPSLPSHTISIFRDG